MYFITEKTTKTGQKLQALLDKGNEGLRQGKALAKKYGFQSWRGPSGTIFGGLEVVVFDEKPDSKIWKQCPWEFKGYIPRKNKEGSIISEEFKAVPFATKSELNEAANVSTKNYFGGHAGFNSTNKKYFGIMVNDKYHDENNYKPPKDCREVTYTEFRKHFPLQKKKKE